MTAKTISLPDRCKKLAARLSTCIADENWTDEAEDEEEDDAEEQEPTKETKAEGKAESKEQPKSESKDDPDGWTPAPDKSTFIFLGAHDAQWPKSTGLSKRDKDIARRKEQSNA